MSIDPHWIIKKTHEQDGNSSDDAIDPVKFRTHQSAKLVLHTPYERAHYLNQLDQAIGAEDGTSLKSKAELLQLRQSMAGTHEALLKLGR